MCIYIYMNVYIYVLYIYTYIYTSFASSFWVTTSPFSALVAAFYGGSPM